MPDKYDEAIAKLLEGPAEEFRSRVVEAWGWGPEQLPLFASTGPLADCSDGCGCLTQVRAGLNGPTPELTLAIRADDRLPKIPLLITPESLPVFAEWQRRLDIELKRGA